jgi:hypothetical protein
MKGDGQVGRHRTADRCSPALAALCPTKWARCVPPKSRHPTLKTQRRAPNRRSDSVDTHKNSRCLQPNLRKSLQPHPHPSEIHYRSSEAFNRHQTRTSRFNSPHSEETAPSPTLCRLAPTRPSSSLTTPRHIALCAATRDKHTAGDLRSLRLLRGREKDLTVVVTTLK